MNLSEQNSDRVKLMLAAQDRLYAAAKTNIWLLYLAAAVPFVALLFKPYFSGLDDVLLTLGALGALVTLIMERITNNKVGTAARIQEDADLRIFGSSVPSNDGLTDGKVDEQSILDAAGNYQLPPHRLPWYSAIIDTVKEPSVQVLLCQRENTAWDWRTRNYVAVRLAWLFFAFFLLAVLIGIVSKHTDGQPLSFRDWLMYIITPAAALLIKTGQLSYSFYTTGKERQFVDREIMQEIETYKKNHNPIAPEKLRNYQDRIFKTRIANCIVPDLIHNKLQKGLQKTTTKSTEMIVGEIINTTTN